ncbi:MAG: hypothetical protein Q8P81_02400 [Nanoarchaeota archaeon]|nr:hypothetical protein [Nanoarchaeota archaeon]
MAKKVLSVTIEEKVLRSWKEYVKEESINSSKLIEKFLIEHLKKRGKHGK